MLHRVEIAQYRRLNSISSVLCVDMASKRKPPPSFSDSDSDEEMGSASGGWTGGSEDQETIEIRFVTSLPHEHRVPESAVRVPSDVTRLGLSSAVNMLLGRGGDDKVNAMGSVLFWNRTFYIFVEQRC